jgi:hypothetical protein
LAGDREDEAYVGNRGKGNLDLVRISERQEQENMTGFEQKGAELVQYVVQST